MTFWENNYVKILRINHWFKNLFIFCGSICAYLIYRPNFSYQIITKLLFAFLLASTISSVNYIINQITDINFDAKHPKKKNRPLPSGKVSVEFAFLFLVILFLLSFFLSLKYFSFNFTLTIFVFWIAGIVYNVRPVRLKDIPYIDAISESINNPIRFLLGWFVLEPSNFPSLLLLLFTWSVGATLMTSKRYDELLRFGKDLVPYRKTFKFYTLNKLKFFLILYLMFSLISFCYLIFQLNSKFVYLGIVMLIYSLWFYNKIVSGKAKAHNIESFVLSRNFIVITLLNLLLIVIFILFK